MSNNLEKYYERTVNIWNSFCKLHSELYDKTCEEYLTLLSSDINEMELNLDSKNKLMLEITERELLRQSLINDINADPSIEKKIESVSDLLSLFQQHEIEKEIRQVYRLNKLLIDIIEKIKDQNKKNQLFLNKAILNIKDMKSSFSGKKNYTTYGPQGTVKSKNP